MWRHVSVTHARVIAAARNEHGNTRFTTPLPTSRLRNSEGSKYLKRKIAIGLIMIAGGSTAASRSLYAPKYHTATSIQTIHLPRKQIDYSALSTFPSCDIGSLGGLVPGSWGLPYDGKNPAIALVMASAGVTLRMIMNVTIIFLIGTHFK